MSVTVKYLILASSFSVLAISFLIGWWARRKVTSPEAFIGGAKIFGPLTVGLATMAAVGSAFAVVGVPGLVYSTGPRQDCADVLHGFVVRGRHHDLVPQEIGVHFV